MKDNRWINNKIGILIIEMGFLFTNDTNDGNRYTSCEGQCELLKEMLDDNTTHGYTQAKSEAFRNE